MNSDISLHRVTCDIRMNSIFPHPCKLSLLQSKHRGPKNTVTIKVQTSVYVNIFSLKTLHGFTPSITLQSSKWKTKVHIQTHPSVLPEKNIASKHIIEEERNNFFKHKEKSFHIFQGSAKYHRHIKIHTYVTDINILSKKALRIHASTTSELQINQTTYTNSSFCTLWKTLQQKANISKQEFSYLFKHIQRILFILLYF